MKQILQAMALVIAGVLALHAQPVFEQIYLDTAKSAVRDTKSGMEVDLHLDQAVVHRVFTLADPYRIVMDFQNVSWQGLNSSTLLNSDHADAVYFGQLNDGWARMVIDLTEPLKIKTAGISGSDDHPARFRLFAQPTDDATFRTELQKDTTDLQLGFQFGNDIKSDETIIVLDPGHGGIDPGAQRGDVIEAELMLQFALDLRIALENAGNFKVILTREDDVFVPLSARISAAHAANADLFISLHADIFKDETISGATVYTLAAKASDTASAKLAERHDRSDLIANVDLSAQDDQIAKVLMDIARLETDPQSQQLAKALVDGLSKYAGPINPRPHRQAGFSVLKAADVPSVLIELGFMSNAQDLAKLQNPEWRAKAASGIVDAVVVWTHTQATRARLNRK